MTMQTASPLRILAAILATAWVLDSAQAAQKWRHPETLRAGDSAPDFSLKSPDGEKTVRLSDYRGAKPVVLIFGSYTCPPFRDVYPTLERLHKEYGREVAFLYVYIREAHPEDGWKMPRNEREGIAVKDPKSLAERADLTKQACAFFETAIPAVVDTMDDATDRAYAAWPSRIYLVNVDGKIAVRGDPGPRGLVPAAREVETWLKDHHGKREANVKR
jgi:thiol-disulfide isomerase/thioredoxin